MTDSHIICCRSLLVGVILCAVLRQIGSNLVSHSSGNKFRNEAYYDEETGSNAHKCRFEISNTALKYYKFARILGEERLPGFSMIETCCQGYTAHQIGSKAYCYPNCGGKCINGHCRALDDCVCYNDYVKNDAGQCVFTCPIGCQNGQCSLDGRCKCHRGYMLDEGKQFCRPICSGGCGMYQNCTAPEVCSCKEGYTLRSSGCIPVCEPSCGDGGSCVRPNECTCFEGYKLKDNTCQAECYQKCDNGMCIEKNRCICFPGFKYHEKATTCIHI